jgi:hypothetical protein
MIVRHFERCFAIEMRASAHKHDRLDLQIERGRQGCGGFVTPALRRHTGGTSNCSPVPVWS